MSSCQNRQSPEKEAATTSNPCLPERERRDNLQSLPPERERRDNLQSLPPLKGEGDREAVEGLTKLAEVDNPSVSGVAAASSPFRGALGCALGYAAASSPFRGALEMSTAA